MTSKYVRCPCSGKISLTDVISCNHKTFAKCDKCEEEFPLDKDGFPNADAMIGKVNRIERFHLAALEGLKSTMRYWETMKK